MSSLSKPIVSLLISIFLIVTIGLVLVAPKIKENETIDNTQNIILKDSTDHIELNNNMEIMRDRNLQYTITDVATGKASQLFVPVDEVEKKLDFLKREIGFISPWKINQMNVTGFWS